MNHHSRPAYGGGGPPQKRIRGMPPRGPHMIGGPHHHQPMGEDDGTRLETFKEFIMNQPNDISETEAMAKYSERKTQWTRRRIDEFFKEHKDEEWFRDKYRPIEIKKIEEANKQSKARRRELYFKLIEKYGSDNLSIEQQQSEALSIFLESFSLLLEGISLEELEDIEARKRYAVSSIHMKDLHPAIDKSKIEEHAKKNESFLRVSMSDAQPKHKFHRSAWITYKAMSDESLRDLSWEFNREKIDGHEIKTVVNKETRNRIKWASFWFSHAGVAKADLKNVAKLLTYFEGEECPLLEGMKNYLIEETNLEEQILGISEQNEKGFEFNVDPEILKALDKAILYLRVVHSYDYYAATDYTGEEDMPQKVGIMHVRTRKSSTSEESEQIMREFISAQRSRVDAFLEKPSLSETEQKQLGKKDPDQEVEDFIYKNTIEKTPGQKYSCKLTKKKFTAPEFVRKHIFKSCSAHVEEVRTEVEFFNNYVADPKRYI